MRYLDPKNDLTFKKIFGQHPHLVKSLLNSLLPLEDDNLIVEIEYLDKELVPELPLFKDSMVDVRCKDKNGRQFIVEMQMLWTKAFKMRVLFNAAKAYVRQLDKGKKYEFLQPVYALSIVNETFEQGEDCYYSYNIVCDQDTKKRIDGLHLVFVELPKFKAANMVEKRLNVLWLRFLKEIQEGQSEKDISPDFYDNADIQEALGILQESSYSKGELEYYDKYWDYVSRQKTFEDETYEKGIAAGLEAGMALGKAEGKALGKAEGIALGKEEAIITSIKKALLRGKLSIQEIAEDFEVSTEFVEKVKTDLIS